MISKTTLKKRTQRKTEPTLVETLKHGKNHKAWNSVMSFLSGSTRKYVSVNLADINKQAKEGDTIVVLGKVLGLGKTTKKVKVVALKFSHSAKEKLKAAKCETAFIGEEIESNPQAKGVVVFK